MRRRVLAGLAVVVPALLLAVVPATAHRGSSTAWEEAGVASKRQTARHCGKPRKGRRRVRMRNARCVRVKRLAAGPPAPERVVQLNLVTEPPASSPDPRPGGDPGGEAPPPLIRFVSVAATEWSLTLSRPVVGAGSVRIELNNIGEDPHNLIVSPDDGSHTPLATWPETGPGEHVRQTVPLPAGRYQLWCSLEGHEAAGMSVRLRVED